MDLLTLIKMAKKAIIPDSGTGMVEIAEEAAVIPTSVPTIEKISVDYGREDINNIAKKINEIIDHLS